MQREEKNFSALAHLLAIIPFWGIAGNAFIWYYFKERSEEIIFNAKQAILFQIAYIIFLIFAFVVKLFCILLTYVQKDFGSFFLGLNNFVLKASFVVYVFLCAFAAWTIFQGGNYEYPGIGKFLKRKEEE